ncbi:MAG: hypothetical protein AAFX94_00980 [Myxococcota bacterium]
MAAAGSGDSSVRTGGGSGAGDIQFNGSGTPEDPILLRTADDLALLAEKPGASFALENDIVVGAVAPVGRYHRDAPESAISFSGTLDGRGYALRDLVIVAEGEGLAAALFAAMDGAKVSNLEIDGATVEGDFHTAVIGGHVRNSTVENVRVRRVSAGPSTRPDAFRVAAVAGACVAEAKGVMTLVDLDVEATLAGADVTAAVCGVIRTSGGGRISLESIRQTVTVEQSSPGNTFGSLVGHALVEGMDDRFVVRNIRSNADLNLDEAEGGSWSGGVIGTLVLRNAPGARFVAEDVFVGGALRSTASFNQNGSLGGFAGLISVVGSPGAQMRIERVGSQVDIDILSNAEERTNSLGGLIGLLNVEDPDSTLKILNSYADLTMSSQNLNTVRNVAGLVGEFRDRSGGDRVTLDVETSYARVLETLPETLENTHALVFLGSNTAVNYTNAFVNAPPRVLPAMTDPGITTLSESAILEPERFAGWDFDTVWLMEPGEPPRLRLP